MIKYISVKAVVRIVLVVIFILLPVLKYTASAQNINSVGTQISDGTSPNVLEPNSFSLMELNSKEKGFLLPRMTTAERKRIPIESLVGGMAIYNTTIECIEFYNTSRLQWMSVCGDVGPATFVIPDNKCSSLKINGEYTEGVFLDSRKNTIIVEVNVSVPGTYEVEAIAYDDVNKENGYSFYTSGVFPQKGDYVLVLKGNGTPVKGYARTNGIPSGKDNIKFFLNKKESTCKTTNEVEKKALSYDIIKVEQIGNFYTGVDLGSTKTTGKMLVTISNISKQGTVTITTQTVNGIYFKKSRLLTPQEVSNGTAIIELEGFGSPIWPLQTDFVFTSNSYVKVEQGESVMTYPYFATISKINVTIDCSTVTTQGDFYKDDALTVANKVIVPVKVNATGRGKIRGVIEVAGAQTQKIEFESEVVDFKFNAATNDIQKVEMKPVTNTGKPTVGGTTLPMVIQMSSQGIKEYDPKAVDEKITSVSCIYNLPIKTKNAEVTIYCQYEDQVQVSGKYRAWVPLDASNYVTIFVDVKNIGAYNITTNTVDGIKFSSSGTFNAIETVELKLYGSGTPTSNDKKRMTISVPTNANPISCAFDVKLAMSSKTMLTYSNNTSYGYGFDKGHSKLFIDSPNNFGSLLTSTVAMEGNITVAAYSSSNTSQVASHINNHNPALISIGFNATLTASEASTIAAYVRSGGALLAATDAANANYTYNLLNAVLGTSNIQAVSIGSGGSTFPTRSVDDPVLNGPFGDIRNRHLGDDATGGIGLVPSSLGSALSNIVILSQDSNGNIFAFRHKTLNFVWMGDGGFNSQSGTNSAINSTTICPFVVNTSTNRPITKTSYGNVVYNSQFTANALAWLFSVTTK